MGSWTIYNKNGLAKAVVKDLELHDEWMAECFLTVSVKSAKPIQFAIGDYIDYRDERYIIQYDPNVLKKAKIGAYGEGFNYDSIKFVGLQDEIVRCDFNDIVLNDNEMHYTSLPTFPFYCASVDDLLDRIQANLEDLYPGEWVVIGLNTVRNNQRGTAVGRSADFEAAYRQYIDPTGTPKTDPYGNQSIAETADNITCWDAMKKVHDDFGLNFIVRGRVIVVGTAGVFTAKTFRYGKGNGLYEIERIGESDQQIVTRLRTYGSEKNLPQHYYANLNTQVFAHISNIQKFSTQGCSFLLDLNFDSKYFTYRSEDYPGDSVHPNYIVEIKANNVTVRGFVTMDSQSNSCYVYCEYTGGSDDDRDEPDAAKMSAFINALSNGDRLDFVNYINKDTFDPTHKDSSTDNLPNNMSVSRLMLPGFPNLSLNEWVQAHKNDEDKQWLRDAIAEGFTFSIEKYRPYIDSPNIDNYGIRPASIFFDGSNETTEIHPTITGMEYGGVAIDAVYAADQVEDNGVFPAGEEVKNININLPDLGFDLGSLYVDGATIDMTSGMCGARSFKVANKPKQDANGRWVCNVERVHDESLDLWFPYKDFQITSGDKYVLTGISLPDAYVDAAAIKLLQSSIEALKKNHAPRYTYKPRIDEIFMQRQHDTAISSQGVVSLHDTLKAGDVFVFADTDMGIDASIIIDVLSIKENGNNGIPTYDITLRDEKQVGTIQKITNKIDSVINGAVSINGGAGGLTSSQVRSLINNYGRDQFLSKVNDDTAQGFIRFIKGLQVGERFVSGLLGEGAVFRKDADGTTYLEADKLYVRMKAYFDTVEIRKYLHSAGNRVASVAGAKCIRVEYIDADGNVTSDAANAVVFRCYFRGSDGDDEVTNDFLVGDQVYCHITNGSTQSLQMHHYWRLLVGRNAEGELTEDGEHWIDLSNRPTETVTIDGSTYTHAGYQTGSDIPVAQDDMVQLGNISDKTRQGAIIEYVSGADSPSYQIYQDIDDFSLNGKNQLALGYNTQTGRAYLNVYGDAYIGDRNGASYIRYNTATKKMEIKAEVNIQSTFDGKTLPNYIAEHSSDWTEEEITALFTDDFNNIDAEIKNIQKQVDGSIETWFYNGVPSSSVLPESEWKAKDIAAGNNNERLKHLGDLYYDNQSGYAYRYTNQGTESVPQFVWTQISDSAVIKALENAAKAQDTADHKRRVFVRQPLDSEDYDVGDLWVNATYPSGNTQTDDANGRYYNDILKCIKHKDKNVAFSIGDWGLSSKYTDDSALELFKLNSYVQQLTGGELSQDIANAQQAADDAQADADAAAAAAANAKTAADNAQADATAANNRLNGWANDGSISPTEKTSLKLEWENVKKEYIQICNDADKYGVSKTVFANAYTSANSAFSKYTAATPENITIGTDYANIAAYYAARQTILDAITQAAKKVATDAATAAANAQAKADSAYTLAGQANAHAALFDSIRTALNQGTLIDGGLVLSTLIGLRDGDNKLWSGISGAYNTDLFGGGLAAWYGGGLADAEHKSQYPSDSVWAKSALRFDGSGYLAGGNITWNDIGAVTIKNLTTLSDSQNTNLLNELATFNSAFSFATSGSGSTTVLSITPNVPFTSLSILDPSVSPNAAIPVATQKWVGDNYVSIAFFKRLFQAHNGSANVNPNDSGTTITDIEAMFGFWTNQYISALGKGSGGSGGGGVGDVTWDLLASGSDTRPINISHLTGALSTYALKSEIPTNNNQLTNGAGYVTSNGSVRSTIGTDKSNWDANNPQGYDYMWYYGQPGGVSNKPFVYGTVVNFFSDGINNALNIQMAFGLLHGLSQNISDGAWWRGRNNVGWDDRWHRLYDDNHHPIADVTIRLQTARTIWGQSFDGTANVSGNLTGVGSVSSTGSITASSFIKSGGTSVQFLKADGSVDSNTYAMLSQLGNYLPLSGGTLASQNDVLTINSTSENAWIYFQITKSGSLARRASVGYYPGLAFIANEASYARIGVNDSGTPEYWTNNYGTTKYALIHAGNIGSYNAGSVTKLQTARTIWGQRFDGTADIRGTLYLERGLGNSYGKISFYSSSFYTWYFYMTNAGSESPTSKNAPSGTYVTSWALRSLIENNSGYGWTWESCSNANTSTPSIIMELSSTTGNLKVAGGIHAIGNSSLGGTLGVTGAATFSSTVTATTFVGSLSGNASTATALQTARTLWGQSFNGTANVNGCIHVTGTSNWAEGIRIYPYNGWTTLILCGTDNTGASGTSANSWSLHSYSGNFFINRNGANGHTGYELCNVNGNWGFGTVSPSYKLHVAGTFYASGDTTLGGILSMGNNQRIYFKNTSSAGVSAILMDTSNNFVIGEGMSSYNTYLRGSGLTFQTGSSHLDRMTIDANGRVYVVNGAQGLRIGDALLTWDSTNNAIKVSAVNGSGQVNFYATGGVSALGVGGSGSSSGGIDADWLKNNDVQIKRLGINVAPSSSYQLNVQGASNFTGAVAINSALTVNSSVSAIGGFSTSQGSISAAHDITAGGNGLVYNRLTVGKTSVDTSYIFYVNGSACVSNGIYLASNVYIKHFVPASGVTLCNITAPSGLTVNGSSSWSSDMRKKDVVSYVNDLDVNKVAKAPVFRFTWKDKRDSVVRVGTSAQYWQNALASSVMDMGEYGLMLDYNAITIASAVVTARKVVDHELHIKQLEERVRELESEIKQLKAA